MGDSLTQGTISSDYVALLRERFGGAGYEFVNAGTGGNVSYGLLGQLEQITACEPDFVTILIGTNDANFTLYPFFASRNTFPERTSLAGFRANLTTAVRRLRTETTARVALLSIPPLGEETNSPINRGVAEYNAVLRDLALSEGATTCRSTKP